MTKILAKLNRSKPLKVGLVSVPSTVLLDKNGTPYSPVRTNYFPHAQVLLGTILRKHVEKKSLPLEVEIIDLKSLYEPNDWRDQLISYGSVNYGDTALTKYFIAGDLGEIEQLSGYGVVGITANFTMEANSIAKVISEIREVNQSAIIVVGGRDASARPSFYRKLGADVVVIGDADRIFPLFIESVLNGNLPTSTILTDTTRRKVNPPPLLDFSPLEYPSLYGESGSGVLSSELWLTRNSAYFETSRGCSSNCDFCTEAKTRRTDFPLTKLKEMAIHYRNKGFGFLLFSDDNLLHRLKKKNGEAELIEFFNFLRRLEMAWEFSVGLELGLLMNKGKLRKELIDAMFYNKDDWYFRTIYEGSAEQARFPFEGALRLLAPLENLGGGETINKLVPWSSQLEILSEIIGKGVPQINLGVMLGFPQDTYKNILQIRQRLAELEELRKNINPRLMTKKKLLTAFNHSLFCLMPLPGTPLYENMNKEGRIKYSIEEHPELWNVFTSVLEGNTFSAEDITKIRMELLAEFSSQQIDGKVSVDPAIGSPVYSTSLVRQAVLASSCSLFDPSNVM